MRRKQVLVSPVWFSAPVTTGSTYIGANSSPAKGRVGRAHKTLQDRLVKELRLARAATLAEGNALLPAFVAHYNARFGKAPANKKDLDQRLDAGDDLEDAVARKTRGSAGGAGKFAGSADDSGSVVTIRAVCVSGPGIGTVTAGAIDIAGLSAP